MARQREETSQRVLGVADFAMDSAKVLNILIAISIDCIGTFHVST